ncbi:hypothetical protein [Enterococcus larvae]|uniref:hypothetical protein n=1 Tax=Enterococcus larvae TaxID=2794352 RepID=UPI003F38120D
MLVFKKRRLLFVLLLLLVLGGCSRVSKNQYEQTIANIYSQSGLDGKIAVEYVKGEGYLYTTPYTRVVFDYTEIVGDRAVTVSDTMFFEHNTDMFEGDTAAIGVEDLFEFDIYSGVIQSFAFQEESIALKKVIEKEVTEKIEIENFKLKEVEPHLMTVPLIDASEEMGSFADNLALYKEDVAKNQKENKPFRGYYDIDIKKYMERGLILASITYENYSKEIIREDIDELKASLYKKISELDVSDFYDGIYTLSFDTITKDSSSFGSGSYIFHVKDKKISTIINDR